MNTIMLSAKDHIKEGYSLSITMNDVREALGLYKFMKEGRDILMTPMGPVVRWSAPDRQGATGGNTSTTSRMDRVFGMVKTRRTCPSVLTRWMENPGSSRSAGRR